MAHRLDERDRAILDLVQRDNRLTSDAIGERVGLGATAVQRRLKRLRDVGVIEADVYVRMGWPAERILSLFMNPFYVGPHQVYRTKGDRFVRDLVHSVLALWRPE